MEGELYCSVREGGGYLLYGGVMFLSKYGSYGRSEALIVWIVFVWVVVATVVGV